LVSEPLGGPEAGETFRPLRLYRAPPHQAARKEQAVFEAAVHEQTPAGGARSAASKRGAGYAVYDPLGQKLGVAEEVFANRDGEPVYVRVRIGLFGRSVLIPVQFVEADEKQKSSS
jgi:hypothetical protein